MKTNANVLNTRATALMILKKPMPPIRKLIITSLMVALTVTLLLPADEALANKEEQNWDSWRGLGQGYVGRRKVPKNSAKQAVERKLDAVDERLNNLIVLRNRLDKKSGAKSEARLDNLDKRITKVKNRKKKLRKQSHKNSRGSTSVWLRNQGEGLYSVPISELAEEVGYTEKEVRDRAISKELALTNQGQAVPWLYYPDTESIIYVGEQYDTFYSDQNAYRLSFSQSQLSKRMGISKQRNGPDGGVSEPFIESLKFEQEPDFFYSLWTVASEPDADYWFWDYLYGGYKDSIEVPLVIPNPAVSGAAQIRVTLRGWTDLVDGDEHQVLAELNGVQVGSIVTWDAFDEAVLVADFDQSVLNADGDNQLVLRNQYTSGTHPGQWLDQIEVDYLRMPSAQEGSLWLHNVAQGVQTVSGFSSEDILVIRNPVSNPKAKRNVSIYQDSDGSFSVSFKSNKSGEDFLVTEVGAMQSVVVEKDRRSNLVKRNNRADYLIISPREFKATAKQLKRYRQDSFGNVKIAWIDDIYDEFSAGRQDPHAITRFIDRAKTAWRLAPSTIVILGKGSIDHKDRMGYSDSFVPVLMTDTPWALTASDDRLLNGEQVANISIGRIPIISDEQGIAYLTKLRNYETQRLSDAKFNSVLVADNPDKAGDFHANSDLLAERLVDQYGFDTVDKNYHPQSPSVSSQMLLDATWEAGLVSYDGHGSATQVGDGREKFIVAADVTKLTNTNLPVFASLTCAAGDFTVPGTTSLAGALVLNPNGGAIAAYSPSGLSIDQDAQTMGHAFFDSLYMDGRRIGEAARDAKTNTAGSVNDFMRRMYSVIGDPAINAR
jgi:hypothetical protein